MDTEELKDGEISAGEGRAAVVGQILESGAAPGEAAKSIEEPKKRGRPRKDGSAPAPKKKSGTHATKAQLQAKIAELKKQLPQSASAPPTDGSAPDAASAPGEPQKSALHDPEVRARFAAGVSSAVVDGSSWIARRRGKHWKADKLEGDALGAATADAILCLEDIAPTLAPYLAKAVQLAPLGTFLFVAWGIVGERMEIDAQIANGERQREMPVTEEVPANFSVVKSA